MNMCICVKGHSRIAYRETKLQLHHKLFRLSSLCKIKKEILFINYEITYRYILVHHYRDMYVYGD